MQPCNCGASSTTGVSSWEAGSAPVYKTPLIGGYGAGLSGAVGGISQSFASFGSSSYGGSYAPQSQAFPAPAFDFGASGAISSAAYQAPAAFSGFGIGGASFANLGASTFDAGFGASSLGASGFGASALGASGFGASSFGASAFDSSFGASNFGGGFGGAVSVAPPIHLSAPPQFQFLEAPPPMSIEAPPCAPLCAPPCAPLCPPPAPVCQYVEAPPVVLQLPAPQPCAPAPLPPPPSVIHIKDDSGPKIASLQAEIRRLERLLAAAKEAEAGMRAELAELQTRLEIMGQKEAQHAACEAEVAKLREQLLEAQRRITFLEGQRDEAHKHIAFLENQLKAADGQIAQMAARIRQLEQEIANLQTRLQAKQEVRSQTNVHETYKVKTFEIAAKLAVMDGTDDGMYNGLPIEVEGEGLYKDLVARGRRCKENVSLTGRPASVTTTSETYKVQSFEMAEKLSKMDGTDDGKYNGLPIEVSGEGLYTDLVRMGRRSAGSIGAGGGFAQGGGFQQSGGFSSGGGFTSGGAIVSGGGGAISGSISGGQTYKVSNMEMAAKISKMGGADDGTYKGLPIEVQGMGLYRELRGRM